MSTPKRSLLDIQAEQKREQQQQQQRGGGGYYNNNNGRSAQQGGGRGGRRGMGGGRGRGPDLSRRPIEQGVVCTLRENFGFIYCADRPEEVFFHFSEVQGCNPADLRLQDQVEFKVIEGEKKSAHQVKRLPEGKSIVWETEVEPGKLFRGLVDRSSRFDRGKQNDGTIRLLIEKHTDDGQVIDAPEGPLVKFQPQDYQLEVNASSDGNGGSNHNTATTLRRPNRLSRGDLVEFKMVQKRRDKEKYAKEIKMLLSEKERCRQEQEKKLLAAATEEVGVVTALKGEYGFLLSNKRREEVYFHYSSIDIEESEHACGVDDDLVLKEGQEMKFLVVDETGPDGKAQPRLSARRVSLQPKGSVKFHDAVACGVSGVVIQTPQPVDSGHSLESRGKILLNEPIKDIDPEGNDRMIAEVYLSSKDSPGGTYAFRGGSSVATWVQLGDTLLFDVVSDYVDASCHAAPTKHLVPNPRPFEVEEEGDAEHPIDRRVRLIHLSLMARAEGVVNNVKEAYGFIHFAERPVDVHFKLYQMLPDALQQDIRRNMGIANVDDKGRPLKLEVGVEVQFDISVHGKIHGTTPGRHRGRKNDQPHERENLKAQRVLLLPPNTIEQTRVLATKARGVVSKEDQKQMYAGTVDLDEQLTQMSLEERHPLVAKMIDWFLESNQETPMVFHDILSSKEDDVIINMLELKAQNRLAWMHLPQPGEEDYPGRLCIRKLAPDEIKLASDEIKSVDMDAVSVDTLSADGDFLASDDDGQLDPDDAKAILKRKKKKKKKGSKAITSIRFDKSSLTNELKDDIPPGVKDIVEFDVVQSRRTGMVLVENMRIVERRASSLPIAEDSNCGLGVVKEVVPQRNFGFISVLDETANKREMLFFSLSSIVGGVGSNSGGKKKPQIRRGDEVKFNIATEKNGKRVAQKVTVISKGTIPNQADKNACRGFILMEPTRSSLKNTPIRHASSTMSSASDKSNSRWTMVDEDLKQLGQAEPITEQGCILLIEDPAKEFSRKPLSSRSSSHSSDFAEVDDEAKSSSATNRENGLSNGSVSEEGTGESTVLAHLRYKNGAIAIHGAGSSSSADDSSNPRRGDLVTFGKGKKGGLRDIRIVSRNAATLLRGRLEDIQLEDSPDNSCGTAKFIAATDGQEKYDINLSEVVSCDPKVLKEKESVEGILHEGQLFGICRTVDLYLETKRGAGLKERPKLNLTVKKDRGGKIMAQSMMAKGPDGTNGFVPGWTSRVSRYASGEQKPEDLSPS